MAWADPASWSKTDTELAAVLPAFYSKRIREIIDTDEGLWQAVETDPLAQRSGTNATFMQYALISPQAASTVLTEGANPDPTDLVTGKINVDVVEKGGVVAIPSLARLSVIDGAEKVAQVVGTWGAQSMERHAAETLAAYLSYLRVDADSSYEYSGVTDGAGDTTSVIDAAGAGATYADDIFNGGILTIIDPYNATFGEAKLVTDFATTTGDFTTAAFSAAPGSGCKYHVSKPTGIVSTDRLTLTGVRLAQKFLRKNGCKGPNWEIDGGGYNMVYDAVTEADIQADLISAFQYKNNEAVERKYPDRGMIAMCKPTLTSIPFRSAVTGAATYSATGIVHYTPIFGKNCLAKLPLGQMDIKVIAKGEDSGGTSNPLNRFSTTGWEFKGAFLIRNAAAGVCIMSGEN